MKENDNVFQTYIVFKYMFTFRLPTLPYSTKYTINVQHLQHSNFLTLETPKGSICNKKTLICLTQVIKCNVSYKQSTLTHSHKTLFLIYFFNSVVFHNSSQPIPVFFFLHKLKGHECVVGILYMQCRILRYLNMHCYIYTY